MTPRERVQAALAHCQPDHTPCDYFATPEIHAALIAHFGIAGPGDESVEMGVSSGLAAGNLIGERLGTDIRYVNPPYIGPPPQKFDDGSTANFWGIRLRPMPNQYGLLSGPVRTFEKIIS